ncbi:hypothetical protein [Gryllotalpicola protaetiae]|uniref:Alpha/beta hydrolase n=1 Tax=Gryllotalpicola protaetiae TaxID=2419771 RepID=A0A387BYB2_9MICO|nr:hypothetical protein [Gryllotalpicola protaetiae]AYG03331.1 hypothetical protein D7I44_07175 [Gryllotalpicola protaetiae]
MPFVPPTATTPEYALVIFDAAGREVAEADGSALSTTVAARVAAGGDADVVLMCHGWLDDLTDAKNTYRGWLTTAHGVGWPEASAPLVVGVHWPSVPAAGGEPPDVPAQMQARLADGTLLESLENAGVELADFLSFWGMRERAISLGATDAGLGRLLARIFAARPGVRVHLVGHSLGCVALSGALVAAGAAGGPHAASFFLVQAAESSWAFSASAPFFTGGAGKYAAVISDGLVDGPLVATRSSHDGALAVLYRLGMEFVLERSYAAASVARPARSAAIGAEGLGFDPPVASAGALPALEPGAAHFAVEPGHQYSIDCSAVITGHNDVDHAELARLFAAMVAA